MKIWVKKDDIITTPYNIYPHITPYKGYKVLEELENNMIAFRNDNNDIINMESHLFFEINLFHKINLYRIFKTLIKFKTFIK